MKRLIIIGLLAVVGAGVYWFGKALWEPPLPVYRVTEVCSPCMHGRALNGEGEVAGVLTVGKPTQKGQSVLHAGYWAPGKRTTDLGTLGGTESQAQDLNDAGHVVGIADLKPVKTAYYGERRPSDGFIWKQGRGMVAMARLARGSKTRVSKRGRRIEGISPVGVNNHGQVVGCATFMRNPGYHAFFWDPKHGMTDLGTLGGKYSCAIAVNDRGQVIGNSELAGKAPDEASHAFVWDAKKGMTNLGTLGGASSYARAINNEGQIVGSSNTIDGELHAFLWDPARGMRDLGTLGGGLSSATGINDKGTIVGDSAIPGEAEHRVFLWTKGKGMVDLQALIDPNDPLKARIALKLPRGINNRGQILLDAEMPAERREYSVILSPIPRS